jgi:alkylated DNA repair dioxygenase AlkB
VKLALRLTELNGGKAINYLSVIAYENEMDHIDWHQHNEDRCRDAKVFIVSLGEVRTLGIRHICKQHPPLRQVQ